MIRYPVYLLMLILLYVPYAQSEPNVRMYKTGSTLANECLSSNMQLKKSVCPTYLIGVSDGIEAMAGALRSVDYKGGKLPFCKPKVFTVGQYQLLVTKYLKEHPEELHHSAATLIFMALTEAFPC